MTRPALPDQLNPGDPVFVARSANDMRRREPGERYIPARIVKASRVWIHIDIDRADMPPGAIGYQTWRMRRDTQDEGTSYSGDNDSFVTPEQREYDEKARDAGAFLSAQGIRLDYWHTADGYIQLADLIRNATPKRDEPMTYLPDPVPAAIPAADLPDNTVVRVAPSNTGRFPHSRVVAYIRNHPTAGTAWRGTDGSHCSDYTIDTFFAEGRAVIMSPVPAGDQ